jgi:hypothetical protein
MIYNNETFKKLTPEMRRDVQAYHAFKSQSNLSEVGGLLIFSRL